MPWNSICSRRSPVLCMNGAVATNDPIASEVGLSLLKSGANAAEAAVGIAAVLNLVDPGSTGLGGDAFVMFYDAKTKTVKGINGSGRSPKSLSLEMLKEQKISLENGCYSIPSNSGLSITVPGAAAAWIDTAELFGKGMPLAEILKPAIRLAEHGFPVHQFSSFQQQKHVKVLQKTEFSFGNDLQVDGMPPEHGQVMKNEKLANVYKMLIEKGKPGFYDSWIAKSIVHTVQACGGCMTLEDLRSHESTFDDPISTVYRGIRVHEMPPNGQGLVALLGLNILEGFSLNEDVNRMSAKCFHSMIESLQLAFADGFKHIADPSQSDVPLDTLLSTEYADQRRKLITMEKTASAHYHPRTVNSCNDTVYFSVVDQEGNACSFINSIYSYYGTGLVPQGCGFALQCRGSNFSLDPSHPNCVGPEKRSYHTIIPGMTTHAGTNELYACFGVMGGFMQPQGHLQVLSNLLDFGMDPQAAVCYPRFMVKHFPDSPPTVCVEDDVDEDIVNELKQLGHNIEIVSGMDRTMFGRGQVIQVRTDKKGNRVLWCGSESRADGCAMGY